MPTPTATACAMVAAMMCKHTELEGRDTPDNTHITLVCKICGKETSTAAHVDAAGTTT